MAIVRTFVVGQDVSWSSIRKRQHHGVVRAIVPAGEPASGHVPAGRWTLMFNADTVRRRQSYLVSEGTRLYRPIAQAIEPGLGFTGTVQVKGAHIDWFGKPGQVPSKAPTRPWRRLAWIAVVAVGVGSAAKLWALLGMLGHTS